ncbi:MAG TPA: YlbD family protein [Niallia sp.]|nr:YlbD family protein [Niallia sp.]
MTNKKLHPSIEEFKEFVKSNPKIMKEARSGKVTLQEIYEDWYLLGPNDARWNGLLEDDGEAEDKTDTSSNKNQWVSSITDTLKNMDQNQLQGYIANLNQALGTIQGVISQFSATNSSASNTSKSNTPKQTGPFSFRKD